MEPGLTPASARPRRDARVHLLDLPRLAGGARGTDQERLPRAEASVRGAGRHVGRGGPPLGDHRRGRRRAARPADVPGGSRELLAVLPRPAWRALRLGAAPPEYPRRPARPRTLDRRVPRAERHRAGDRARRPCADRESRRTPISISATRRSDRASIRTRTRRGGRPR